MSGTHTPSDYHSTGRGGFGNIGENEGTYIDPEIIREGVAGESRIHDYSAGRGGAGNMVRPPVASGSAQASHEVIPEPAMRRSVQANHENYHVGRGGMGNAHLDGAPGLSQAGHAHHLNSVHHHLHHHDDKHHVEGEDHPDKHHPSLMDKAKHALGMDKQ